MQTSHAVKNIYLIGFMGCGKSTVGSILASQMNWPFVDIDGCIVQETGMSIPQIFEQRGEAHFRRLEKSWIAKVSRLHGHVVALGGGAVMDMENWENITQSGVTITLSYPAHILASRLDSDKDRPLLKEYSGDERVRRISELLSYREPFYKRADLVMLMNKEIPATIVAKMIDVYLKERIG